MTHDDTYDDEQDTYDDIDDEYPEPGQGYVGDAETLLRRSIDIIATAPTMPLSSSPRLDRDEIIELLEEALQRLPDELRQARWMLKERQEFVAKTRREADELLEAARVRAERMVQRTEVVRAAEQRARQVMETAEADARRLRHETEDFLDQRLGSFEILLDKLQKTVGAGRQRLSIGAVPVPLDGAEEEEDPTKGFFDQDQSHAMPAPVTPLVVHAAELLRRPGGRRHVVTDVALAAVDLDDRRLAGDVAVEVTLESTLDDVVVTGQLRARHHDVCRRCLRTIDDILEVTVDERYRVSPPPADDAFPIVNGQIDLAPMVREEVLLAVPDAPLCRAECPGLCAICGADLAEGPCGCDTSARDERWAVLDQLPRRGLTTRLEP